MNVIIVIRRLLSAGLAAAIVAGGNVFAQVPGASSQEINATLPRLFGNNNAFSAKAELHVLDKAQKETTVLPMGFAMMEGKIRMEMDMSKLKSTDIPPATLATLKQMKLDQIITIIRPDRKVTLAVYPLLSAYVENPMPKEEAAAMEKFYKIDTTKSGRETIDGHACDKNQVVLTDDKGGRQLATVWNATDLKDFPVQIQMAAADDSVIFKFKDVKLTRPDAKQFEAPAGLKKYDSDEALTKTVTGQK